MLSSHFGLSFLWQRPRVPWAVSLTCWLQYELTRETVPVSNFQLLCCGVGPVVSDDVSPRIIVTGVTACQITDIWCMTVWHKLCGPAPIISSPGSSISSSQHISANLDVIISHYFTSNLFHLVTWQTWTVCKVHGLPVSLPLHPLTLNQIVSNQT